MCFCWRHWTSIYQDLSTNFTPKKLSVPWKKTTSAPRRHRSERTRSYCQCSVASLLNSFNCFSMHSTTVDSNMSATSSLTIDQVCHSFSCLYSVSQKIINVTFDRNFGKCRLIFKILSLFFLSSHHSVQSESFKHSTTLTRGHTDHFSNILLLLIYNLQFRSAF